MCINLNDPSIKNRNGYSPSYYEIDE